MSKDIRYRHLGWMGGYVTVAFDPALQAGPFMPVGLAWCSPLDQFSRPKGRLIARGRLGSRSQRVIFVDGDTPLSAAIADSLRFWQLNALPWLPQWTRKPQQLAVPTLAELYGLIGVPA